MEMEESWKRIVGIDLSKRTYEAYVISTGTDEQPRRFNGRLDPGGQHRLQTRLKEGDLVIMEAGTATFRLVRYLSQKQGVKFTVLNPAKLRIIFDTVCKTDREDAKKLAKLGLKFRIDELPAVSVPTEEEQSERELVSMRDYLVGIKTQHKNKLHAIFMSCGHPEIRGKHMNKGTVRNAYIEELLTGFAKDSALMITDMISAVEAQIHEIDEKIRVMLLNHAADTALLLSIPGVGPVSAATILAYVGDIARFSSARQLCNYAGLVPKMDCSGQRNVIGGISHRGNPHLRKVMVQGAWSNVRTKTSNPLKEKYERLKLTKPKQVAVVATARELLSIVYAILKNRSFCQFMSFHRYLEKLKEYGLMGVLEEEKSMESERIA
jgi:transposase